jgi:UTP--glucose-1-phosphate uridylyltransferase
MIALGKSQKFHGVRFDGRTYDTGSKLGFLTANIAFALARADIAPALREEIKNLLGPAAPPSSRAKRSNP